MRAIKNVAAMILSLGLAMSGGCAVEGENEAAPDESAVRSEVTVMGAGTWQLLGIESCLDFYQRPCTTSMPSNQCPTVVEGQACTTPATCKRVMPGNQNFKLFHCQ